MIYGETWYCFPKQNLAYLIYEDATIAWIFSKDVFKNNNEE